MDIYNICYLQILDQNNT